METFILAHEPTLRLVMFGGMLSVMGLCEWLAPRRPRSYAQMTRWMTNLGLSFSNSVMLRFTIPILAVGAATYAAAHNLGLLNLVSLPAPLEWLIAFILLDLLIYGQHALFHFVPIFWRLHKVHHADPDIDTSTGVRFHPVEILLSMGIKLAAVIILGAAPVAVIVFEIVLNATSLFNHANVKLPLRLDRLLRLVIVTPDMHRVHHSVIQAETDSNFGFNLSIWDRVFRTYQAQPRMGHLEMEIGLSDYPGNPPTRFLWCLGLPFQTPHEKERA